MIQTLDLLPLLPRPRRVRREPGSFPFSGPVGEDIASLTPCARNLPAQGYRLLIAPDGIRLEAADEAGAFYGRMTLRQLVRLCPHALPCGLIEDWPDIPIRGVMLDISRDKVPTLDTLFMLVDRLAEWKVNHLQLYMEHTFAYRHHREVWAAADPLTAAEIRALDAYCRERFVELTPNQNSFGHMERWLKHPRYRPLAECPDGFTTAAGQWRADPTTLDPTQPASLELMAELYAELLPNFSSRRFNIGCDETWELGKGRSRPEVERLGLHRVYLEYLGKLKKLAVSQGRTPQYWGDMVWNRFPDRLDALDREMVHVDWGYYRNYRFREHGEKLSVAGVPFWVAPGTSAWSTLVGCNEAALGSNRTAARAAIEFGSEGILNTDWGDDIGHWQHVSISFIGFAAGAAIGWCEARNTDDAIRAALDPFVFQDSAGVMGPVAWDLADTWQTVGENTTQAHMLDHILRGGWTQKLPDNVTEATLRATVARLDAAVARLAEVRLQRPDAALMTAEFADNARLARYACRLGVALCRGETGSAAVRRELADDMHEMIAERRRIWLARNRAGGLEDSLKKLTELARGPA